MKVYFMAEKATVLKQLQGLVAILDERIAGNQKDVDKLNKSVIEDPFKDAKIGLLSEGIKLLEDDKLAVARQVELLESCRNEEVSVEIEHR